MVVAVHQPNYLPWLGYFKKALSCDVFVFLDHVQLPQGRSYVQRAKILNRGREQWLTAPVVKSGLGKQRITDVRCDEGQDWRERHLRTLEAAYGRHPHFGETMAPLRRLLLSKGDSLAEHNIALVQGIAGWLGAKCRFVRSSELECEELTKSDLLINIVKKLGGDAYLHGKGGLEYQEEGKFVAAGISLKFLGFEPFAYSQPGSSEFVPGLSVLDCLFSLGHEETVRQLSKG